jgi:hypothetical protein
MAKRLSCTRCGTPTTTSYLLCDPCCHAFVVASCEASGVPVTPTDAAQLRATAALLRLSPEGVAA